MNTHTASSSSSLPLVHKHHQQACTSCRMQALLEQFKNLQSKVLQLQLRTGVVIV